MLPDTKEDLEVVDGKANVSGKLTKAVLLVLTGIPQGTFLVKFVLVHLRIQQISKDSNTIVPNKFLKFCVIKFLGLDVRAIWIRTDKSHAIVHKAMQVEDAKFVTEAIPEIPIVLVIPVSRTFVILTVALALFPIQTQDNASAR